MRPLPIDPVPAAAPGVLGVAVIRGVPTPVLRLAEVLGVADRPVQRFVTIGVGSRVVALAVDQVIDVATIDGDRLEGLPPLLGDGRTSVIESIATADAELLYLLQGARLIEDIGVQ